MRRAALPLADGSTAVAFFNYGDKAEETSVQWEAVSLPHRGLHARDLWKHEDVRASGHGFEAKVPAHGTLLLRVSHS